MWVSEREFVLSGPAERRDYFAHIIKGLQPLVADNEFWLRFVITESTPAGVMGEALILHSADTYSQCPSIAPFRLFAVNLRTCRRSMLC
jgi:hypothetical protein